MPICKYYSGGGARCRHGDNCVYEHVTPSKPCKYYTGGGLGCSHGNSCRYDHITPIKSSQWYTKGQCRKFFSYGYCSYGDSCIYSHQIRERNNGYGYCPYGDYNTCPRRESCTYIHRGSNEFQKKIPIHAKGFPSAKSSAGTLKQPHGNFNDLLKDFVEARADASARVKVEEGRASAGKIENVKETSQVNCNEKFYTTRVKPSVKWQTKDQIVKYGFANNSGVVKYGFANPCGKRRVRSPSTGSKKLSSDLEMPPVKRAKISVDVKQSEFNVNNDKLIPSLNTNKDNKVENEVEGIDSLAIMARNNLLSVDNTINCKTPLDADFHGFSEYEGTENDLTKAELNTQIINMENKYEENCSEFAHYYLVVEQKEKIDQSLLVTENNNTKFASNIYPKANNILNQQFNDVITHPMEICQEDSLVTTATKCVEFSAMESVKCSECSSEYPAFVTGLIQDLKGTASWRCKDCTECAGCKKDDCSSGMTSLPMMMCSICGDHYHVEEGVKENSFFCKACGDFADYLLQEQDQFDITNHGIAT